jgi:hypothetical protein
MEGLKKRNTNNNEETPLMDDDYNTDDLPYKGKVFLARRKKPDSWKMIGFQVLINITRNYFYLIFSPFFSRLCWLYSLLGWFFTRTTILIIFILIYFIFTRILDMIQHNIILVINIYTVIFIITKN